MSKRALDKQGFTLIEIIVSLLLVGIVAAAIGLSGVNIVKSFLFDRNNAATLQKGQIAIARIQKELNNDKKVFVASSSQITFSSYRDAANHTISWGGSGTNLLLDSIVLTDKVSSFSLYYYDNYNTANTAWTANTRIIEVNLEITGGQNTTSAFKARVARSFIY